MEENEIIKPRLDVVFKRLFMRDTDLLKCFVADMLEIRKSNIKELNVLNPNILPPMIDGKQSQLDLKMSVDDKIVNVEIQLCNKGSFPDRSLYYWAKMFSNELKRSENYTRLKQTICVNIVDFTLFDDCDSAYSNFALLEETRHTMLTDKCSIMFMELPKINNVIDKNDRKKLWLQFLKVETKEELAMLEKTGVPDIKKAAVILHEMSADDMERELAWQREKAIADDNTMKSTFISIGEERGLKKGRQEGRREERESIIAMMRENGYSEEEIQKLFHNR